MNRALILLAPALLTGCTSRPSAVGVPRYDPDAFATAMIGRCDADGGGTISKQEAEAAPGIAAAWTRYDANGDGALAREELVARATRWTEGKLGLAQVSCIVRLEGRGVDGVKVRLVPDDALAEVIKPAECTSSAEGSSLFFVPDELQADDLKGVAGMQFGLYRVEVSHPSMNLAPAPNSRGRDIDQPDRTSAVAIDVVRK